MWQDDIIIIKIKKIKIISIGASCSGFFQTSGHETRVHRKLGWKVYSSGKFTPVACFPARDRSSPFLNKQDETALLCNND